MTRDVAAVPLDAAYKEVAELLHERRISAVPVIDADRRVIGIVSEADLLLKEERPPRRPGGPLVHPHGDEARAMARNAGALMTSPAVTVESWATLTAAARRMHHRRVKRLPVVDEEGRLVGIVSRADLLQPFVRSDDSIAREVREDVIARTLVIDPEEVTVSVEDGVVRTEGELETRSLGRILVRLVRAVEGVVEVEDRLRWRLDDTGMRPDLPPQALHLSAEGRRRRPSRQIRGRSRSSTPTTPGSSSVRRAAAATWRSPRPERSLWPVTSGPPSGWDLARRVRASWHVAPRPARPTLLA